MGKMTASFKASFAPSSPATSFHLMLGFSMTMAPGKEGPLQNTTGGAFAFPFAFAFCVKTMDDSATYLTADPGTSSSLDPRRRSRS